MSACADARGVRRSRRLLLAIAACIAVAFAAAPANAARVVSGSVTPASLSGTATAVMFFHPF